MRPVFRILPIAGVLAALACSAFAQTDVVLKPRVWNDIPGATYNISAGGSTVTMNEQNVVAPKGYADRDDFVLSYDGVTPATFNTSDSFKLTTDLQLTSTDPNAQVEAGLRLSGPGDVQLTVKGYGDHAIFAAGSPLPFTLLPGKYNMGQVISLGMEYLQQGGGPGFNITVDGVPTGFISTPGGTPAGTMVGGYFQVVNPTQDATGVFRNTMVNGLPLSARSVSLNNAPAIPEPGTMSLLGIGLLALLRRRR